MKNLLVMKFGGTSMGSADRIRSAAEICAAAHQERPTTEVVFSGDLEDERGRSMLEWVRGRFAPNRVMLWRRTGTEGERLDSLCGYVGQLQPKDGGPTVYVCEHYACKRPVTTLEELKAVLM